MTFTELFGSSPRVKLLDFLADHIDYDYTISEMNEFTAISRPTLYKVVEELVQDGLIVMTRTVGDSRFYRLNLQNPRVISMLQTDFERINAKLGSGMFEGRPIPLPGAAASGNLKASWSGPHTLEMRAAHPPSRTTRKRSPKGAAVSRGARPRKASTKRSSTRRRRK